MIVVNLFGLLVSVICLANFYKLTPQKEDTELKANVVIFGLDLLLFYVYKFYSPAVSVQLGYINAAFSIFMFGSPLVGVSKVLRHKVTDGIISLPVALIAFIVSGMWSVLGFNIQDPFVYIPNVAGAILSLFQILLCLMYGKSERFLPLSSHRDD
jgi:uncharacterized membrane protein YjfL (UPF0719 family)